MFFKKKKPYIKFVLDENTINIESFFEDEKDDKKVVDFVKNYSNMLIFIQSGQLLKQINESIKRTSAKSNCFDLSVSINKIVTTLLSDFYLKNNEIKENVNKNNKFCMSPEDVFAVRND